GCPGRAGSCLTEAYRAYPPTCRTLRHPAAANHRRSRDACCPRGQTPQRHGGSMEVKPGYKQTEVGVIPEEWGAGGLGRFWSVTDCKHITAEFVPYGIPL